MKITVLRLGHRIGRDKRITAHVALVARAMGCSAIIYSGQRDKNLEESIKRVIEQWGGPFEIKYTEDWKKNIKNFKGTKAHLTVYGMPFQKNITKIRKSKKNLLVIVGGEKVPPEVYQAADLNLSITSQPHSEVAAMAIFLHEYFKGKELSKKFKKAKLKVIPQERGKLVKKL